MRSLKPGGSGKNQSRDAIGISHAEVERHASAHRNAANDRATYFKLVHECAQVVGKDIEAKVFGFTKRLRGAMSARIKSNQPNVARRQEQTERLRDIFAQTMLKEKRRAASAAIAIMKREAVAR